MIRIHPTGSYYICNPPVLVTDIDFVLYSSNLEELEESLIEDGFFFNGKGYENVALTFKSYKKQGEKGTILNYIVCQTEEIYTKYVLATEIAKNLNLLKKEDRIELFKSILK